MTPVAAHLCSTIGKHWAGLVCVDADVDVESVPLMGLETIGASDKQLMTGSSLVRVTLFC